MTLITPEYVELNRKLHAERADYGASSARWAPTVADVVREMAIVSILDYGCGKRQLEKALGFSLTNYDPAIEGCDAEPAPHDLVVCTDVLEHIEPECIDDVLDHLRSLTLKAVFLTIATRPAKKFLADGRNAHLIQHDIVTWMDHAGHGLMKRWTPIQIVNFSGGEFLYIGSPR